MNLFDFLAFFVRNPVEGTQPSAIDNASSWVAVWSLALIIFVISFLTTLILVLRHRARRAAEEDAIEEEKEQEALSFMAESREEAPKEPLQPWERPADWWKDAE